MANNLDKELMDYIFDRIEEIKCVNIYWYYVFLCIIVICDAQCSSSRTKKLYIDIERNEFVLNVLKQNTSGVAYFVLEMENIYEKRHTISLEIYEQGMRKIGIVM